MDVSLSFGPLTPEHAFTGQRLGLRSIRLQEDHRVFACPHLRLHFHHLLCRIATATPRRRTPVRSSLGCLPNVDDRLRCRDCPCCASSLPHDLRQPVSQEYPFFLDRLCRFAHFACVLLPSPTPSGSCEFFRFFRFLSWRAAADVTSLSRLGYACFLLSRFAPLRKDD